MARRSNRRGRVTTDNARRSLPLDENPYRLSPYDAVRQLGFADLLSLEDRRTWHPEGPWRPARSFQGPRHRLTLVQPSRARKARSIKVRNVSGYSGLGDATLARVGFAGADRVAVCIRRRRRREVMHAIGKTGRGHRKQRRPRRNWTSKYSCKG